MSSKLMIALGVLVALAAITFIKFNSEQASDRLDVTSESDIEALDVALVNRLEISAPNKPPITLLKNGALWTVGAPVKAPASQSAVEAALEKLATLKVSGVAATNSKNHQRLEVTESTAVKVVAKRGDQVLADLRIGAYRAGNTMVRRAGQDQVASVQGSIRYAFDKALKDFRDRTITELDVAEVQSFEVIGPQGKLSLVKNGDSFKLAKGSKPAEHFDPIKAKALVSSAARLSATDFASLEITSEEAGFSTGSTIELNLGADAAGPTRLLLGAEKDGLFYLRKDGNDGSEVVYRISSQIGKRFSGLGSELLTNPATAIAPTAAP